MAKEPNGSGKRKKKKKGQLRCIKIQNLLKGTNSTNAVSGISHDYTKQTALGYSGLY